jgi:hypothetical protein
MRDYLRRLHQNKQELLLVLEWPDIPLHTNDSERDVRDYVKSAKSAAGPAAKWADDVGTPSSV